MTKFLGSCAARVRSWWGQEKPGNRPYPMMTDVASLGMDDVRGEWPSNATSSQDILCVGEVTDAEFFVGELFRRKFRSAPPDFPRHFVSFYRAAATNIQAIGYVHYSEFEDSYLCGGLAIDDRLYRRMPAPHRQAIRSSGGIAEHLMKITFARLSHSVAIWGYVGDVRSERVVKRAGLRRTEHPYVMVCWMRNLPDSEKAARLSHVVSLGPF
jgi:hypothetical protein